MPKFVVFKGDERIIETEHVSDEDADLVKMGLAAAYQPPEYRIIDEDATGLSQEVDRADRTVWRITAADLDAVSGRELTDGELAQFEEYFGNTSVGDCIAGCLGSIIPDDEAVAVAETDEAWAAFDAAHPLPTTNRDKEGH